MIIEFKCPHCGKGLEADVTAETALKCPVCGGSIFISQQFIADAEADSLLDPADPAGAMNYFPEENNMRYMRVKESRRPNKRICEMLPGYKVE